jgi:hypothetical protein
VEAAARHVKSVLVGASDHRASSVCYEQAFDYAGRPPFPARGCLVDADPELVVDAKRLRCGRTPHRLLGRAMVCGGRGGQEERRPGARRLRTARAFSTSATLPQPSHRQAKVPARARYVVSWHLQTSVLSRPAPRTARQRPISASPQAKSQAPPRLNRLDRAYRPVSRGEPPVGCHEDRM